MPLCLLPPLRPATAKQRSALGRERDARQTANGIYYFIQFQPRELLLFVRLILSFSLFLSRETETRTFVQLWRATLTGVDAVLMNVDMFLVIECLYLSSCRPLAGTHFHSGCDWNLCEDKRCRARASDHFPFFSSTATAIHSSTVRGTHVSAKCIRKSVGCNLWRDGHWTRGPRGKERIVKYFSSRSIFLFSFARSSSCFMVFVRW